MHLDYFRTDLIRDALSNVAVQDSNDEDSEMWLKYLSILPFFQKITVGDRIAFDDIFCERDPESNKMQMYIKSQVELIEMQSHIKNLKTLRQAEKNYLGIYKKLSIHGVKCDRCTNKFGKILTGGSYS